jgi:hypothetical protein
MNESHFLSQIWELKNLTLISITLTWHPGKRGTWLAEMFGMLSACPQLRDLRIVSEMRGPDISVLQGPAWAGLGFHFLRPEPQPWRRAQPGLAWAQARAWQSKIEYLPELSETAQLGAF